MRSTELKASVGVRRVVHRQHDAGDDHDDQDDPGERAEIPPVVQVARCRIGGEFVLEERDERQPVVDPADRAGCSALARAVLAR